MGWNTRLSRAGGSGAGSPCLLVPGSAWGSRAGRAVWVRSLGQPLPGLPGALRVPVAMAAAAGSILPVGVEWGKGGDTLPDPSIPEQGSPWLLQSAGTRSRGGYSLRFRVQP